MMKLITALDLNQWADKKDSEGLMPELMRRLIHASIKDVTRISFPNEDCVDLPGFDGVLETTYLNPYVPVGLSAFEIGTNKGQKSKADGDYNNRIKEISDGEKANTNFVFVIPRKWKAARKWEKEKNEEKRWKSVKVLTAIELEDWLSLCPSVAVWLLAKMGMINSDTTLDSPEGFWKKWAVNAKGMMLDYDIMLGGREGGVNYLISELATPNIVSIVSGSTEESLGFSVAAILSCGDKSLIDRSVIVNDSQTIKELMSQYQNLVIITSCEERNFNYGISNNDNSIVYVTNLIDKTHYGTIIELGSHDYHKFQDALVKSGMTEVEARAAAKDSGRNVMVLRHQHGFDLSNPDWTKRDDLSKVIPALLLGRWNEEVEGDQALLEEIMGMKWDDASLILNQWLNYDSSPFQRINHACYVVSPYDAFLHVKDYITKSVLDRFVCVLKQSLDDLDPNAPDKLNPAMAVYTLGKRKYSGHLRDGLCLSLILVALDSKGGQMLADTVVKQILENSSINWWLTYSSSDVVSYLAEASPKAFVEYVEGEIKKEDSIIRTLFAPIKKNNYFSGSYEVEYTQILFAMEMLAWMPEYLLRISYVLAELDTIPNESNYTNKPFNSLLDIYRLWFPLTSVDAEGRSKALGALMRKYPETGLKLCFALATRLFDQHVSFSSLVSRWRLKDVVKVGRVSGGEIYTVLLKICLLIDNYQTITPDDAIAILNIATDNTIPLEFRNTLLSCLTRHSQNLKGSKKLYERLIGLTNRFKNMPNARWQISDNEKHVLNDLLVSITPERTIDRVEYLLSNQCYQIPEIQHINNHEKRYKKVLELRLSAVNQIVADIGIDAFIDYAVTMPDTRDTLMAFARREDGFDYFEKIYSLVKFDEAKYTACRNYFRQLFLIDKKRFIEQIENRIKDDFVWFPLSSGDPCDEVWKLADSLNDLTKKEYWKHTALIYIPLDRVEYLNEHFIEVGRYNEVIQVLYHVLSNDKDNLDVNYVVDTMRQVMSHLNGQILRVSDFELERVMEWIDKNEKVSDQDVISLELPYIISDRGNLSVWRAYRIIIQNPKFLFELIDYACFPDDESRREEEIATYFQDEHRRTLGQFSAIMLTEIHTMPCVDDKDNIDETALREYIDELIRLGREKDKLSHVYHTIGRLLACYPKSTNERPPEIICDIIDELYNKTLCASYHARIYNRLGSTVRGPFDGGGIEWNKSKRFNTIAEELQVEYPITASIYRSLASDYEFEAKRQDEEAEMLKLDS